MASDLYVINRYIREGRMEYAWPLMCMLGLNIFIQLFIVWMQCRNLKEDRWRHMFLNWLYVITCVKPGVDAYRLCSGAERLPGSAGGPAQELVWSRNAEMFSEAIPGFVIQSVAFLTSKDKSTSAALSLLLSAGSASMVSTTTAYDSDIDVDHRKLHPEVCGMIPDNGRGFAFANLFLLGALQMIAKGVSVALLAITNPSWLGYYLGLDMAVLFLYKLAMRDFLTWHPLPISVSIPFTIIVRIMTKTISDFSGSLMSRYPTVLGGAYFTFSLVQNQASVLAAVYLYNEHAVGNVDEAAEVGEIDDAIGGTKLKAITIWSIAIGLVTVWTLSFLFFLFRICVPKYRSTFWSTKTGSGYSRDLFLGNDEDYTRFAIFDQNRMHWKSIEGEVKEFTFANWGRWVEEKPDWFTAMRIATVPDEFIPPAHFRNLGMNRERRGSAAGSVRLSVRRMSQQLELPVLAAPPTLEEGDVEDEGENEP
jgi:hypothetical protein